MTADIPFGITLGFAIFGALHLIVDITFLVSLL
jgi:hypothetical protein